MVKMIFAYIENFAYTLAVRAATAVPKPECHLTRKLLKPAQVAKVVNTERERGKEKPQN
jgi:hypothetical protein